VKKVTKPYEEVDLDAWIAELVSQSDEARLAYEEDVTITEMVLMLISLREKSGLTQKELAEKMGISQQMVSKMEHIDYEGRTFSKLWRHLDALGYRPEIKAVPIDKWRKKHPIPGLKE
jgi:DNA-binding transcriptional regulator YiaG